MCQVKLRPVVGSFRPMEIGSGPRLTWPEWTPVIFYGLLRLTRLCPVAA